MTLAEWVERTQVMPYRLLTGVIEIPESNDRDRLLLNDLSDYYVSSEYKGVVFLRPKIEVWGFID
jgi:hypothetical protein